MSNRERERESIGKDRKSLQKKLSKVSELIRTIRKKT